MQSKCTKLELISRPGAKTGDMNRVKATPPSKLG